MTSLNATLAAIIVLVCLGLTLVNTHDSFTLDLILGCVLLGGVIRPAWITWLNWLNQKQ
jgi:hypothetical protein